MAMPNESVRSFPLFVTHVDSEGHFLKISGQLDKQVSLMLEKLFVCACDNLEKGIGAVPPAAIHEGIICAAKYRDGVYYRAKITSTNNLATGLVGVHFIDYGNKDNISLSTIRFLDTYDPIFLQVPGQATEYYLSRVMHPSGKWEEPLLLKLQNLLCNDEYPVTVEVQTRTLPIISIQFKGTDLSTHLVTNKIGIALPVNKQEELLQMSSDGQVSNWQLSSIGNESSYTEHIPFLMHQNFPLNPASAMRLQQNVALPFNGSVPPPSMISQRLMVNKVSRNSVNLRPLSRQPQHTGNPLSGTPSTTLPIIANKQLSPKKSTTYKSRLLELNSQHKVFVSFSEEGPELFAVQLVADAKKLQDMMDDINKRPHSSLAEPPMIGTVCLGRMSGDRIICRAIVMNLSGSQCKLFFVDFGDTEMVSYYDIFDIPEEFVKPNVFAMRFCLSGVKKLEKGPYLTETFKQLVNGKVLTLRVVAPEGPPLIQYGELYLDNKNVLDLLLANMKDKLQFKWMDMLNLGTRQSVLVSYVDSCIKFYIQLSDKIDELNAVMDAVRVHCENSTAPRDLPVGAACCARFPDDDNWYRARIRDVKGNKVVVAYVDYGNEQEIDVSDLRTITPDLIKLPAQAMKCALKGFESKPIETKTSNLLEMLALEKTLMAHIVGVLSSDTMLVSLVDDTVNPPLDVARRMNQLSQPRVSNEAKATTPVRKEAPDTFSSPEGSTPDEGRKKNFRREKSFKDDRRPRENEEFAQRSGSFRGRDNKDGFDRSAPGRHSEKFGGRQDRGERRSGPKPWENNTSHNAAPAPADDNWDETPQPSQSFQTPSGRPHNNRDNNRDRRKPRSDHHDKSGPRPGWKNKDSTGVGKRLRQAAEAASLDAQNAHQKGSIQDRLKRDNKFSHDHNQDNRNDDWGNKNRENRPDHRENRGERRDKKENWNQKREFRDRQNDRPRSNFTPRERAERSFNSDSDKKSDRSFRSQDSGRGERAGRTPPYKTKSKFTQVQYKELQEPVPLETPFIEPTVEVGAQHEVSVTWIISPESFHTQILSLQSKFLEMMHKIPELYKGVKSYTGVVPVGSSVLARYPADGVLYRATVIAVQPPSQFIVRYVDFGNKQLVDAKDIWQLDRQLMDLPKMAVHCSLLGVVPKEGEWKADPEIDLCFNAPRYQCVFQECLEDQQYKVSLWNNGASVADMLVEKGLAALSEHQSSVTLKDEAIDLTIIVGQQILCKVTHVESFEKFYVQLDLDKAALVENAIETFDTSQLTPLSADSLAEGIHCTLKHEGKIYRAILDDVVDTANIKAVLPDYGNSVTAPLENLMILPSELSVYFYQSLECKLNNYTAESKTLLSLDELKERLTGNKFIIYINDVQEISLVSTLYDSVTGQKVAIFEPDEGAYDEVVQLCMRAVFNYNFGLAYISHSENLNEFYLQKSSDGDKIAQLLDDLFKFYEEGAPEDLATYEVDGLCAAKSTDGNWYRATIISITENELRVQFPDYGNSETVPKTNVKKLDSKFYEPCTLALVASLGLVSLQEDTLAKLTEWTNEKEVQVTLAFGNDGWLASLHLDGVDLAMKLVNEKLATPQIASSEEQKIETPLEEPISLPPGCTQVYISHIDTPGHFWLQMIDKIDKIEEIQAELQSNAATYADIENRELGTLCVAKYLADDQWYRAEILDADSDITTVRFIDYGNTDVLDNQPDLIKVIPDRLKEIERYAVKSSVNAIPTGTGQWSEPASDFFTQLVGDISSPVDALIVLKDVTTYVDIFVNGVNITDKLVSEGYATRSEEAECGDLPSCFASHVNSPSEFWIQLETAAPELQAMESAMVDAENFPELTDKEEGVICAAKYPEDGAWYRAQVIVDGSEGTEVLFMDYGNASIANELRSLPDELKVKPALSRKCALQKPRDIKSWSRKSEIKFNELAAEGATIFNVQFIASGDISIVELYLEGKSVTEELVGLCEEQPTSERPTPVGQDLNSNGKICYVNALDEFYVQLDEKVSELDKVIYNLTNASEFEQTSELKVGSLCAAFWAEDEQWYRAKILEFCDVGYHVQFIDYGNKAKCEEFRQLPEEISRIEPLAKCCRLVGITEDNISNENIKSKLNDLAADVSVTFQIEFLDSTKEPNLVRLLLNGKDISATISSNPSKPITENRVNIEIDSSKDNITEELNDIPVKINVEKLDIHAQKVEDKKLEESVIDNKHSEEAESELNTSQPDLDESVSSNHTVIENKSFEGKIDNLSNDVVIEVNEEKDTSESLPDKIISSETLENSSDKNVSAETLENSSDKNISAETLEKASDKSIETIESFKDNIKSPERDESKDSINTDTGYTSDGEQDKPSPSAESESPKKESPTKEAVVTDKSEEVQSKELQV
ncbi:maternal protein tudor-like isoform X1 [Galleria mellonella]|uniref:Maternal protein tudor-like isoform X1 n=1 Tax=Galleria mellonella TaxID=7137 RepID=A0A6J1X1E8_GALME|nr:maternal protein tudor-like isoform X1 [Galleria mellonella]